MENMMWDGEEKEEGLSLPIGVWIGEKNEAAIYRRMERKKKTMKEIKKEKEEKWNVSGRKEMVSGMVEMKSYGNEPIIYVKEIKH